MNLYYDNNVIGGKNTAEGDERERERARETKNIKVKKSKHFIWKNKKLWLP